MFEVGKVYKTLAGSPAKVLWVYSLQSLHLAGISQELRTMYVLHEAYGARELVVCHAYSNGKCTSCAMSPESACSYDLTMEEYVHDFAQANLKGNANGKA